MKGKFNRVITYLLVILTILTMIISTFGNNQSSAAEDQNVTISIFPKPKVDIVLAKSRTTTNVTNFKNDLMNALKSQGVDTSDVNITSVQAEQVDLQNSFSWQQDLSGSIGSIAFANGGRDVTMKGNPSLPGKNCIYILPPKGNQDQKFTFSYNIDYGDSFNAAGMLLNVRRSGNQLQGYMLSFNNSSWVSASGNCNGAIWKFSWNLGANSSNVESKTLVKGLAISKSGTLTVSATDSQIIVNGGGVNETINLDTEYGSGFGFFSDHYSHGCQSIGQFTLTGINLQTTDAKSFEEILRTAPWRQNTLRFLANVTDKRNNELQDAQKYGEIATRMMNDDVYFATWGTSKNQDQFTKLIQQNDNKGTFINNTNYTNSINQTAAYVKKVIQEYSSQDKEYVIVNEPMSIVVNPESVRNNTIDSNWPYGKWKIEHDYEYYENNMGQFADSGKYVSNFITTFDKTGRYKITFQDKNIQPEYVYCHRRPVASFTMRLNNGSVSLESNSYDLDKKSQNNGISEEEWSWKTSDETSWHSGKMTNYAGDKTYLIKLRVKDFQNTWSEPTTKYIYNGSTAKPVAMFTINEETFTKYEKLSVTDQSYDPSGKTLTKYVWEIYKGTTKVYSGSTIPTDFRNYALGDYTLNLTVTNSNNLQSETASRPFTIINDLIAPEVVVTPTECDWTREQKVDLNFSDRGGSNFKHYKYAITDSQATPSSWSSPIAESTSSVTINQEGIKYLHIIAEDNAGNVSEDRICGPYKIDRSGPDFQVIADLDTIITRNLPMVIRAADKYSGLKSITINGINYANNTQYEITRNGTYTIVATDNIGNTTTKTITVNNIYRVCTEGLNHPIYSSYYDECPICKLVKNIKITDTSFVYDSHEHRVRYDNPDNAPIVEYYNDTLTVPTKVATYKYDLKVVYEGKEYNTHFVDNMEITKKDITITDIKAEDRQYDGTTIVKLYGGQLQGVEESDINDVDFILPEEGNTESRNVNTYNVKVPKIELSGKEAYNYNLIQPNLEDVSVNIVPKDITITNISGVDKLYNRNNNVKVKGGKLQGIVKGDWVEAVVPDDGNADSENVGNWGTKIKEITLADADKDNYNLIQPDPEDIRVNILEPDKPALNMDVSVSEINGKEYKQTAEEIAKKSKVRVQSNDIVTLKIKITNKGEGAGYAKSVTVKLPDTIEPIKNDETNKKYGWQMGKDNIITTQQYCLENGKENELPGQKLSNSEETQDDINSQNAQEQDDNTTDDNTINNDASNTSDNENKELVLELKVKIKDLNNEYKDLPIEISAEQTDINNKTIEDKINGLNRKIILRSNYAKLLLDKTIYSINGQKIGEETKNKIANDKNYTLEVEPKDVIVYKIKVTNEGEIDCYASKIKDMPEDGLEYIPEDTINQKYSWKMLDKNGKETKDITKAKTYQSEYLKDKIVKAKEETTKDNTEEKEETETDKIKKKNSQNKNVYREEKNKIDEKDTISTDKNYQEIYITFKVKETDKKNITIGNTASITEMRDSRGNILEEIKDKNDKDGKNDKSGRNTVKIKVKYFDLSLNGIATKMDVYEGGQLVTTENNSDTNKILKAEVKKKKVNNATIKVEYTIYIKNEGEIEGTASEIKDYIPKGFIFKQEDNKMWKEIGNNIVTTNELANETIKPDETKTVKLVLTWKNSLDNFGSFTNAEEISKDYNASGTKDTNSTPDNKDESEDDYSSQRVIIALATGKIENMAHLLTAIILIGFAIAIMLCLVKIVKILREDNQNK